RHRRLPDRTMHPGRTYTGRHAVLAYTALRLEESAGSKTAIHCHFREYSCIHSTRVRNLRQRVSTFGLAGSAPLGTVRDVDCRVLAHCRACRSNGGHLAVHLFNPPVARGGTLASDDPRRPYSVHTPFG